MSVEEMIDLIKGADYTDISGQQIIAALKAGQILRDEVDYYYDNDTPGCKAWDAATKEGVCKQV